MRWWFEAIVRGLGGVVCDPTSPLPEKRCIYEQGKDICPVCRTFGCTGWKRRFHLSVVSGADSKKIHVYFCTESREGRGSNFWLGNIFKDSIGKPVYLDKLHLHFGFTGSRTVEDLVEALLSIMCHLGAIGAKSQYGFGVFDWPGKLPLSMAIGRIRNYLAIDNTDPLKASENEKYYSLVKYWFYEYAIPLDSGKVNGYLNFNHQNIVGDYSAFQAMKDIYIPVSYDIRYAIRKAYLAKRRDDPGAREMAKKIFGFAAGENDKQGSRVFVSHLFKREEDPQHYRLRVWGFTDEDTGREIHGEILKMFSISSAVDTASGSRLTGGGVTVS